MGRRRKDESLLKVLIRVPWWIGAAGAVLVLVLRVIWLRWAVHNGGQFAPILLSFSYLLYAVAAIFALGALGSLIRQLWHGRLLDKQAGQSTIDQLSWREFERLLQEAFRRQGYLSVETASGPDGGYVIALRKDGKRYLVQCKHWKSRQIDVKVVRELWGVIAACGATGGFVVASGGFTADAKNFAQTVNLQLIDGIRLNRMIAEVQQTSGRNEAAPQPFARTEPTLSAPPNCPKCGQSMVRRMAKKGPKMGEQFWGCTNFPRCHGILAFNQD